MDFTRIDRETVRPGYQSGTIFQVAELYSAMEGGNEEGRELQE
jgi:hypothetical protein